MGESKVKSAKEIAEERAEQIKDKETSDSKQKVAEKKEKKEEPKYVKLTFGSYLIMIGALGWQALGKLPDPSSGKISINLLQAREIIDLLEILEEKTKNNLTKEEEDLLKTTLTNLRINYVEELKKESGGKN